MSAPTMQPPNVAGLPPAEQHTAVLTEWDIADGLYAAAFYQRYAGSRAHRQLAGRRRILNRHAPVDHGHGVLLCEGHGYPDYAPYWPCVDYADAADGLVDGLVTP